MGLACDGRPLVGRDPIDGLVLALADAMAAGAGAEAAQMLDRLPADVRAEVSRRLEVLVSEYRPVHDVDTAHADGFVSAKDLAIRALERMVVGADEEYRRRQEQHNDG